MDIFKNQTGSADSQKYHPLIYAQPNSTNFKSGNLWYDMDSKISVKMEITDALQQHQYNYNNIDGSSGGAVQPNGQNSMQIENSPPTSLNFKHSPQSMDSVTNIPQDYSSSSGNNMSPTSAAAANKKKTKEDKICGVCGDRALGYNFDAISCESCKAFFRRNAPKGLEYFKCPYDEKCKMDISNRRFCKRCRLKKCFDIGMRKEYILTEEEKAAKRRKIEENRIMRDVEKQNGGAGGGGVINKQIGSSEQFNNNNVYLPNSDEYNLIGGSNIQQHMQENSALQTINMLSTGILQGYPQSQDIILPELSPFNNSASSMSPDSAMSPIYTALTNDDLELIEELEHAYASSVAITRLDEPPREQAQDMSDLVNIAEISIRRVIEMAKKIYAFKVLSQQDQISLLKGGCIELLILRGAQTYDAEKRQFLESCDREESSAMKLDHLERAEGAELFHYHMNFVKELALDLKADRTTLNILLVINLFSPDRPGLKNKSDVSISQERYSSLLRNYLTGLYGQQKARTVFPRLLIKLTDIRNLNEEHSQVLLKVKPDGIQPLMQEVLNLNINN